MLIYLYALVGAVFLYQVWKRFIYYLEDQLSAIHDLKKLDYSKPRVLPKIKGTAVICGGSLGGIVAACAASYHFERVIVVEPDYTPILLKQAAGGTPENPRTRIRQYSQAHGFLPFSYYTYKKYFKNFDEEVQKIGGVIDRSGSEFMIGGRSIRSNRMENSTVRGLGISRDGLEPLLRRLLLTDPLYSNVTWNRATVTALELDSKAPLNRPKIIGVTTRNQDGSTTHLPATLVIDASGPARLGLKFLSRLLAPVSVPQSVYDPGQSYLCIIVPVSKETQKILNEGGFIKALGKKATTWSDVGGIGLGGGDYGRGQRFGYIFLGVEGDRATMGLAFANNDDSPDTLPKTLRDLMDVYSTTVKSPTIVAIAEKIVEGAYKEHEESELMLDKMNLGKSQWNHYEIASRDPAFPGQLIVVGDALANVNPAFGTGTTKANIDSVTLHACLSKVIEIPNNFAKTFFTKESPRLSNSWYQLKALDYGQACHVPDETDTWIDIHIRYPFRRVWFLLIIIAAWKDEVVGDTLGKASMDSPFAMLHPFMLLRIVKALLWGKLS